MNLNTEPGSDTPVLPTPPFCSPAPGVPSPRPSLRATHCGQPSPVDTVKSVSRAQSTLS